MPKQKKQYVKIGVIGHVGYNKTTLNQAIQKVLNSKPETLSKNKYEGLVKKYENQPIFENAENLEK